MVGLVDSNNFFVSCERVFRPDLINKPVLVLSNNDGCVIARSNEVKKLGIKMGVPAYQIREEVKRYNIIEFSSNYILYGDMSNRVMSILSSFVQDIEIYSIDEAFLDFKGFKHYDLHAYGKEIVQYTTKATGIPVSMGIAPTKTLAKIANRFAKKYEGYNGLCIIDSEEKRVKALQLTTIGEVWGIGRRTARKLTEYGINTAYDLTTYPQSWIRKQLTVTGERTWKELRGLPCIGMEHIPPDKKQICTSRMFGVPQTSLEGLSEAIATYAGIGAEKLRKQHSCALSVMVFIRTNSFFPGLPQYSPSRIVSIPQATNSTFEITKYALEGLRNIYREGYRYKKAGVIIIGIVPEEGIQGNLFDTVHNRDKQLRVMKVMDEVNSGFNRNLLSLAITGTEKKWKLKREKLSPAYTTELRDIIKVK